MMSRLSQDIIIIPKMHARARGGLIIAHMHMLMLRAAYGLHLYCGVSRVSPKYININSAWIAGRWIRDTISVQHAWGVGDEQTSVGNSDRGCPVHVPHEPWPCDVSMCERER